MNPAFDNYPRSGEEVLALPILTEEAAQEFLLRATKPDAIYMTTTISGDRWRPAFSLGQWWREKLLFP